MKCGNSALQIQIVLRCLKALSLLQFLKTCLMASFKPDPIDGHGEAIGLSVAKRHL
ncbi:hypothetical protein JHK82_020625 [Glycine max]|nr:hypothetical protein JHK82_020625 [Glycine max]